MFTESSLKAAGWEIIDHNGFIGLVGPIWRSPERPAHHYGFIAQPKHENRAGTVQGGMLMTFADRAMGMASRDADPAIRQATAQFSFDFIDAGQIGKFIEIRCEVMRRTRSLVFVRSVLECEGHILGTASGIWKMRRKDTSGAQAST